MKRTSGLVGAAVVIGLILGTFAPIVASARDCALKLITSIDLIVAEGGTVIVPVELNGKKAGLTLQLEGIASFITPGSADEWSLPRQKAPRDILFGNIKVTEMAQYETLTVGDLKYNKGFFLVVPAPMYANTIEGREIIGFLSGSAFNGTDFELDIAHKKLNIFSQDHCPGDVVYWADKFNVVPLNRGRLGEFSFPMDLEGKKVQATITTMVPATTVATDVTRKFYGFDKSSPGIEKTRDPDGTVYHYRAMRLTAPGLTVTDARVLLVDPDEKNCPLARDPHVAHYRCQGRYPLQLGGEVLRGLRLYFATKEKKLYFTSADASTTDPRVHISPK